MVHYILFPEAPEIMVAKATPPPAPTTIPAVPVSTVVEDWQMSARYKRRIISQEEIDRFLEENKPVYKSRSTINYAVRNFTEWCKARGEGRPLEEIPKEQLARCLRKFFLETRKQDGSEYEVG